MIRRVLIWLLLPVLGVSQEQFRFDHLTIKDGLSQNTVHCVLKDKEGYYWIGTQDGLNRYDGYSVKTFRHDKDDSASISDNFILTIREDRSGNLWIGTRNGFNRYDKKKEKFYKIISNEKERENFHASVWNQIQDKEGNILYSNAYAELVRLDAQDSEAPPFHTRIVQSNSALYPGLHGNYYLADPIKKTLSAYGNDHRKRWEVLDSTLGYINAVLETDKGQILVASSTGLHMAEKGVLNFSRVTGLDEKNVNKLLYDSKKDLWVGTSGGLYVFADADLSSTPSLLTHSTEDIHSLGSNSVQELYEDPDGMVWVGTSEGGVSIFDPEKTVFKVLNHSSPLPLSGNSVWGIFQDGNELWVGTNSGLNHLKFENAKLSGIYSKKNKLLNTEVFYFNDAYPNCIAGNSITAIVKDKKGKLWFASNSNGISVFDPVTKKWEQYNSKNSPLRSDVVFDLFCASDGKIWISTLSGFYAWDPAKNGFQSFLPLNHPGGTFPSGYTITIYEDKKKNIWVGTTGGIYLLNALGETLAIYKSEPNQTASLSYNMVTSFLEDSKGRMWICTLGGGIDLFDATSKTFRAFTQKDGLANDITYRLLEDKQGKLWISSNSGLSCFDPENKTFMNFTERDGLAANEFCQNSGFVNEFGELLYGSPEGLVLFDPADLKNTNVQLPLIISSLKINYQPVAFSLDETIVLHYSDKTISFEFTSPNFRNQEKIQYAFQLQGFDDTWHPVSASSRVASFTSLPFGNYVFKVRVRAGNGEWQKKQLTLNVHVIPPFWLRPWFVVLCLLASLALIVYLVRYYSQRKLRKKLQAAEMQQMIHLEKERISRDLHDNVGAHLTYIITSLDNISYKMEKGEKAVAPDKISSLSDFSRSTMQQLRESIWAINKENITLEELKDKVSEYSAKMASAGNMNFSIEFNSSKENFLKPSHAINIYRIVQEAINNSVKHSGAQSLSVAISKNGGKHMTIEVKDNGKGMALEANGNGYGLKNMQDRVKDLGGEITIDSDEKGTKVSFTIPV